MRLAQRSSLRVVLATLLLASTTLAQSGPELMLRPFPKEQAFDLSGNAIFTDTGHSKQTDGSIRIGIIDVQGRFRLNPGDEASPRLGFGFKYFDLDTSLPGVPKQFYDQNVGFAMPVAKMDDWIVAVGVGAGYAGQAPFGDGNAIYGRASVLAFKKIDETSALGIGIDYDGNRTFKPDVPLPGFVYMKRIQDNLQLSVGVPVTSVSWEPIKDLRIQASYLLLDNFSARVGYAFMKGWEVFGSVGQRLDAFFIDNSLNGDDRLLYQQREAELGVTYRLLDAGVGEKEVELTAAVGYAFNRELSVGFDTINSRLLSDVSDEPYVRFEVKVKF